MTHQVNQYENVPSEFHMSILTVFSGDQVLIAGHSFDFPGMLSTSGGYVCQGDNLSTIDVAKDVLRNLEPIEKSFGISHEVYSLPPNQDVVIQYIRSSEEAIEVANLTVFKRNSGNVFIFYSHSGFGK